MLSNRFNVATTNRCAVILCLVAACQLALLVGCQSPQTSTRKDKTEAQPKTTAPVRRVKVGADGTVLGDASQRAMTVAAFTQRVDRLLASGRNLSARLLVWNYPDLALELLRGSAGQGAGNPTLQFIANAYDRQIVSAADAQHWSTAVRGGASSGDVTHARRVIMDHLQRGQFDAAADVALPAETAGINLHLAADVWHLSGVAALLANRRPKAAEAFTRAADLIRDTDAYHAALILVLLSETHDRLGDTAQAARVWEQAVTLAATAATTDQPAPEPGLWERAIKVKPAGARWPKDVAARFAQVVPGYSGQAEDTATTARVTEQVGHWRLERAEPQAALVAFRGAQRFANRSLDLDRLHLAQSRSLIQLGQSATASVSLQRLTTSRHTPIKQSAMALLGVVELRRANKTTGLSLLQKAIELDKGTPWPNRADACADLGLAYLMTGDEQRGLQWLHDAQTQFQASNQPANLIRSLQNELTYFESKQQEESSAAIRGRLNQIERGR